LNKIDKKVFNLEQDLIERYKQNNNNNFSYPEIKPIFNCIADILLYFKQNHFNDTSNESCIFQWHINQTLELIKNASQTTICTNINYNKCPIDGTFKNNTDIQEYIDNHTNERCDLNIYQTPYNKNNYPYAYCIRVLVQVMTTIYFINIYFKSKKSDTNEWGSPYSNIYFKVRYHYYLDYLLDNVPNVFILPILQSVGATGLLWNRCSRLQPCGLVFDETFVDEDIQSPSNFFWHDINHARRIYQNNIWYANNNNINIDELYNRMKKTVEELMPIKNWLKGYENKYESMIKILLFEIVHEDALPFLKDQIINDLLFESGICYPYERTYNDKQNISSRINLRFYEQGASTLRTIYNKVTHAFFEKETPNDIIVKIELRNIKDMVISASILLKKIDSKYDETTYINKLNRLIKDKKFSSHNHHKLSVLPDDPDDQDDPDIHSRGGKQKPSKKNNKKVNIMNQKHKTQLKKKTIKPKNKK